MPKIRVKKEKEKVFLILFSRLQNKAGRSFSKAKFSSAANNGEDVD